MSARRWSRTTVSWMLAGIVAVCALAYGTVDGDGPDTNADRTFAISRTILCPQCAGQSVAESDVAISREIRADIARRVDAGESDDQIRAYYVDRYGPEVLLTPPGSGLAGLMWVIPVVGVAAAAVVLALALRRPRTVAPAEPSVADRSLVERARRGS